MKKLSKWAYVYMGVITAITFVPLVVTALYSFNASEYISRWGGFSLVWYRELFADSSMMSGIRNSVLLGVLACVLSLVLGVSAAIGMNATKEKRLKRVNAIVRTLITLPIMIPEIILGIVYLLIFTAMNIPFGMVTLVIAHTAFCLPYVFTLVSERLGGMDRALPEAARDLGATRAQVFRDIIFPQILPAIRSGMILSFAMSFDDVVITIFVTGASTTTLPVQLYTRLKTGLSPEINALATLLTVIITAFILISNLVTRKGKDG